MRLSTKRHRRIEGFAGFAMVLTLTFAFPLLAAETAVQRCQPAGFPVAVDIGHTLAAPGAISADGHTEFSFNRPLAHAVLDGLTNAGFGHSFLIGESGAPLSLEERTRIAQQRGAALFVSIHHDSVQPRYLSNWQVDGKPQRYSDRFHGFSVFFSDLNVHAAESKAFATEIGEALVAAGFVPSLHHAEQIPGEGRPLIDARIGLYRFDQLVVLRTATMPAALLEAGIIVNRDEAPRMRDPQVIKRQADAVVLAVQQVCAQRTTMN